MDFPLGMFIIILQGGTIMADRKTIITVSLTTQAADYLDFLAQKTTKGNRSRWVQTAILKAMQRNIGREAAHVAPCLLYTSPSPRDVEESRMPSSA